MWLLNIIKVRAFIFGIKDYSKLEFLLELFHISKGAAKNSSLSFPNNKKILYT
jgi:hypothetical protein